VKPLEKVVLKKTSDYGTTQFEESKKLGFKKKPHLI